MSDVGDDIKEVLQEVGTAFIIKRLPLVSGEYCRLKMNRQVTKPFIREFFLEAQIPYDSAVIHGDLLSLDDGRTVMVTAKTPTRLENEDIDQQLVLYKCSHSGELFRYSGETRDAQYHNISVWDSVESECFTLILNEDYGNFLDQDENIGQLRNRALFMYVPESYGVQPQDRYEITSGEFLKVEEVEKHRFIGIHVAHLEEDTRE